MNFLTVKIHNFDPFITYSLITFLANVNKTYRDYADSTTRAAFGYDYNTLIFSCSYGGSLCKNRTDFETLNVYDHQFENFDSMNVNKIQMVKLSAQRLIVSFREFILKI